MRGREPLVRRCKQGIGIEAQHDGEARTGVDEEVSRLGHLLLVRGELRLGPSHIGAMTEPTLGSGLDDLEELLTAGNHFFSNLHGHGGQEQILIQFDDVEKESLFGLQTVQRGSLEALTLGK